MTKIVKSKIAEQIAQKMLSFSFLCLTKQR